MTGYKKMDAATKRRWLKQLRSGELKQTTGALGRGHQHGGEAGYCCLGVLVDKCGVKGKVGASWNAAGFLGVRTPAEECSATPPPRVWGRNEGSLSQQAMDITGLEFEAEKVLISLNDSGTSFDLIADWIEENV